MSAPQPPIAYFQSLPALRSEANLVSFFMLGILYFLASFDFPKIAIHPWKIVGLSGSVIFGVRFFLQWLASEKAKKSVIPIGFWECSTLGSLLTLSYFAIYQRDSVGVIMTILPLPIYLRNLYFVWRDRLAEKKAA